MSGAVEMAAVTAGETLSQGAGSDVTSGEVKDEKKEKGPTKPEIEQPDSGVKPKMEEVDTEAGQEKPAIAANKAAREALADDTAPTATLEATAVHEEPQRSPESQLVQEEGNNDNSSDNMIKGAKEEPEDDSRCSGMDCEKNTAVCEDGEKPSGGGGELGDKRRPSVEISSSDGEPLSRMDSEDRLVREQVVL